MSQILITGASGFIGTNLVNYLQSKSFKILPFSRNMGFEYSKIDSNYINNEDVDTIVHLAGKAHDLNNVINEKDYFEANTDLTIDIFDAFLKSNANTFLYFSSVKAVKDHLEETLTEKIIPNPITSYGKSKLAAENHILSKVDLINKRIYILRPSMVHGVGNKGNLNLLYKLVSKSIPWPLGAFDNKRSFCSIDNLVFVVHELISNPNISNGIYNIADDEPLSTNQVISLICKSLNKKPIIFSINKNLIKLFAKIGDIINLPLNSERLTKLTESYHVSNLKIRNAIGKDLPVDSKIGLIKTFQSFNM